MNQSIMNIINNKTDRQVAGMRLIAQLTAVGVICGVLFPGVPSVVSAGEPALAADQQQVFGEYFYKKKYVPAPLPTFDRVKDKLPEPVIDGSPGLLPMYWKCWQLAFAHLKQPVSGSPLVSNWLDPWFSPNIFQWDTCFMM